jgi:hypothetical protein
MGFLLDSFAIPAVRVMDRSLDPGRLLYYSGYFRRDFEEAQKALVDLAKSKGQSETFKLFLAFFSSERWPPRAPARFEIGRLFAYGAEFDVSELMTMIARDVRDYLGDQDFLLEISSRWLPRLMVEAKKARVDGWADAVLDAIESLAEDLWSEATTDGDVQDLQVKTLGLFDGLTRDDVRRHRQRVGRVLETMGLRVLTVIEGQ